MRPVAPLIMGFGCGASVYAGLGVCWGSDNRYYVKLRVLSNEGMG